MERMVDSIMKVNKREEFVIDKKEMDKIVKDITDDAPEKIVADAMLDYDKANKNCRMIIDYCWKELKLKPAEFIMAVYMLNAKCEDTVKELVDDESEMKISLKVEEVMKWMQRKT
jgi:hypothetical protein